MAAFPDPIAVIDAEIENLHEKITEQQKTISSAEAAVYSRVLVHLAYQKYGTTASIGNEPRSDAKRAATAQKALSQLKSSLADMENFKAALQSQDPDATKIVGKCEKESKGILLAET